MAAAVLFGASSCVKEDISSSLAGGEVEITITANLADLGTRAIGEADYIDVVYLGVYEKNSNTPLSNLVNADGYPVINGVASFSVVLLKDKTYDLVFWAQHKAQEGETNCYSIDWTTRTLTVDYATVASQDETRDAFFLVENGWKAGEGSTTFRLHRPFAQLNAGLSTEDVTNITNNGVSVNDLYSAVVVKNVAKTLDLGYANPGAVSNPTAVGFASAAKPTQALKVNGVEYNYLSMNYLLVNEKQNVDITYSFVENGANEAPYVRPYYNVPVQRNYRTNIIGNLISSPMDFTVIIVPGFNEEEYIVEGYQVEVDENGNTTATVDSAEGLAAVAQEIKEGNIPLNATIELSEDIDLAALTRTVENNWTPIGTSEKPFTGTFNGRGRSIKNLALVESEAKEGKAYIGFFGYAKNATIKNIKFKNVNINIPCLDIDHSQGHIGAVAGSLEGTSTIENVTVEGLIQVYATQDANGASRVAVVAGGNSYGNVTMKNVHVVANEGSYLKANNNVGALAGQLQGKSVFENCSSNIDVTVNKFFAGGIIGLAAGDQLFVNCRTTGNIAVVAGRNGKAHDHYRVGGIAGGWADGKTKVCTLVNCSYEGTLTGINSDGSVAEKFDYFGYVGRGYTLNGCQGSKVVIDGTEFVQKHDTAAQAGIYTINGCTPVSTADELVAALAAGEGVFFMNDITVAASKGGYKKAGILQNKAQTIDGGGHTLTVTGAGATWDCAIYTNGGIIRNLTVAGAMRGIFTAGQSADLHIENVEFKNVVYTFNSDGKMPANPFGVYVSNSKVNGWTSHSDMHTEVVYTDCTFGEGSGYAYCRPYGKTAFVNCTFCAGYNIDKTRTTELTFTDCIWE